MIEQIYTDFTTKLLPKIAEGFTITKDYFMDLFGRYAHFLFVQDLIYTVLSFLAFIVFIVIFIKSFKGGQKKGWENGKFFMGCIFAGFAAIFWGAFCVSNLMNTIKDKYIPEVRIYEELKGFNK
jgi:hypothetical protein